MKKRLLLITLSALCLVACEKATNTTVTTDTTVYADETQSETATISEIDTTKPNADTDDTPTSKEDNDNSYVPNGTTPRAIIDVLTNDSEFICVYNSAYLDDTNGLKTKSYKLSEFNYWFGKTLDDNINLGSYNVVDLDKDGYNEVISVAYTDQLIVFHYEDGTVYGFEFPFRAITWINREGVCAGSSGADVGHEYTLKFNKDTYTETTVAYMDGEECYIGDKKVSVSEYCDYIQNVLYKEKVPSWEDYSLLEATVSDVN